MQIILHNTNTEIIGMPVELLSVCNDRSKLVDIFTSTMILWFDSKNINAAKYVLSAR